MSNDSLSVQIAIEIERKTVGSAAYWTEEDLHAWCFNDPFGKKSFKESLAVANHIIKVFDVQQRNLMPEQRLGINT